MKSGAKQGFTEAELIFVGALSRWFGSHAGGQSIAVLLLPPMSSAPSPFNCHSLDEPGLPVQVDSLVDQARPGNQYRRDAAPIPAEPSSRWKIH